MKNSGNMFIKNLRYMCLVGVIALGLITIIGSNGGEESKTSDTATTNFDTTAPEDVTSLSAQPGDSKVTLSWTASANTEGDLAGQKVYYSSDAGTAYMVAESALSASGTTYEVTGLTNEISYTFKVTCYDDVPNESSGATVSCTPTVEDDTILSNSDFPVQSGLADGGVARQSTQTMTVPNPTFSSDTYGGKAYLVLNGENIPLDVTKSLGGSGWTFTVTFSVNAGPNTICIEVYDSNDVFYAATAVWNIIGAIEPTSDANIYDVTLNDPDLTSFPDVTHTVTVTDPNNNNEHVSGLTSENFYVINAGTIMSEATVTEGNSSYTLKYIDITSGARDLYVYVYVPAEGDTPIKGGLSETTTYGTNYALLVGLNEYPAAPMSISDYSYVSGSPDYILVTPAMPPDVPGDFTITFYDGKPEDGVQPDAIVIPTEMTNLGGGSYALYFDEPDYFGDYNPYTVTYKKTNWLSNCINDIVDLEAALKAKATSMTNSAWEDANIHRLEDSGATETAIVNKVAEIAGNMQKYDLFLFHFSGHGSNGFDDNSQYICAYEDGYWISVSDLSNALDDMPKPGTDSYITNIFVFIDACHSGNFIGKGMERGFSAEVDRRRVRKFRPFIPQREEEPSGYRSLMFSRDLQDMTNKNNVFVMTAAAGDESSWDDGDLQNGVFTYYLVEGIDVTGRYISAGPANTNNDTWITAEEAFAYLDPKVEARVLSYAIGEVQDPQSQDNSTSTVSRLIYNW